MPKLKQINFFDPNLTFLQIISQIMRLFRKKCLWTEIAAILETDSSRSSRPLPPLHATTTASWRLFSFLFVFYRGDAMVGMRRMTEIERVLSCSCTGCVYNSNHSRSHSGTLIGSN